MLLKDKNYSSRFNEAINLSKKNGLKIKEKDVFTSSRNINQIQFLLTSLFYDFKKYSLSDLSNRCISFNYYAYVFLRDNLKINTKLTIGNLYLNENDFLKKYNFEETKSIIKRAQKVNENKFGGHVWLTLDDSVIIDATIFPSIWYERFIKNNPKNILIEEERIESFYKKVICFQPSEIYKKDPFFYEPIVVGEDYLKKSNLIY